MNQAIIKPVLSWPRFSWLSSFQTFAALAMFPLGFAVVSWLAAESPKDNPSIPANWHAGVPNHGEFYQWPLGTVADSPVAFAACALLLVGCVVFLGLSAFHSQRASRHPQIPK